MLLLAAGAAPALAHTDGAQTGLTPDQRAIIDKIVKPAAGNERHYAEAPSEDIAAEVRLPFRGGYITLIRKESVLQPDGSIAWHGEVQETGERALLMLWSNALLTGYFAYNGTIFTIESLGGGVN